MGTKVKTCVVVGASPTTDSAFIKPILKQADYIICADGGWNHVYRTGVSPHLIVGDFDSSCDIIPKETESISLPTHKDDTDMLAAIRKGLGLGYRQFQIYGGLGGRLDHTIANIQCLLFLHNRGAKGILYGKHCTLQLLVNGKVTFPATKRGRISVFAYGGIAYGVTEKGLCYTVDRADLNPEFPIGVSNEFTGCESSIEVENGMLLVYTDKG